VGFGIIWDILMHTGRAGTRTAHLAHLGGYAWGIGLCLGLIGLGLMQRRPYDLFTFAQQMHRRRQIRAAAGEQRQAMAQRFEQAKADQRRAMESDALAEARAVVTRHLARNELEQARRAYRELAERHDHVPGATVLARRHQYTLASAYYQAGDAEGAAYAFGKFLQGYPTDPEAPQVRLLLGLLYARSLNDPVKAKALIAEAINGLDDAGREMARRELAALG
jgi:TolA-binding protein